MRISYSVTNVSKWKTFVFWLLSANVMEEREREGEKDRDGDRKSSRKSIVE